MAVHPPGFHLPDNRLDAMSFHFVKRILEPDEPKKLLSSHSLHEAGLALFPENQAA